MSQEFAQRSRALQDAFTLLVLSALTISLPTRVGAQDEQNRQANNVPTASDSAWQPSSLEPAAGMMQSRGDEPRSVGYAPVATTAVPATTNPPPEAATDIIPWPPILCDPRFAEQRARVEAPYRRNFRGSGKPTAADCQNMVDAAVRMKTILGQMTAEITKSEYLDIERFLNQLAVEARHASPGGDTDSGDVSQVQLAGYTGGRSEVGSKVSALIVEVMEPEAKMELDVHHSKLIRTKVPVTRFSITNPKACDIVQFSPTEFEIVGLQQGQTTLTLWLGDNQSLRYLVRVGPDNNAADRVAVEYRQLQNKINEMFPNSVVQLIPIADKLIVRGQAKDSAEATQILSVLSGRGGGSPGAQSGAQGGRNNAPGGLLNLGQAATPNPGSEELPAHNLINLMNVPGEQQVMLKVRIAQLDRTAARSMSTQLRINSGNLALNTDTGGLSAVFSSVLNPEDLRLALTAVSTSGYTKILAEPNLVTLNGEPASFLAGGKFPVPTAVGIGGVSGINTQFQSFGTQLTFTPTILDKDRIRLRVAPSSSEVNKDLSVNGIPGTNDRSVTTTVDLRVGQWLAIAGLLQDGQKGSRIRVPFVGDIPVLGNLFGQTSVTRHETELIVLVSPELVHPLDACETPLILPGMEIAEPTDAALFLGGAYVARALGPQSQASGPSCSGDAASARQAANATMSRPNYQRSEKYYVYGQHGTSR